MLRHGVGNLAFQPRDQRVPLRAHSQALAVEADHLPPIRGPRGFRIGHHRRDHAQRIVIRLAETRIGRKDDIGLTCRHRLEVDPAVGAEAAVTCSLLVGFVQTFL